MGGGVQSVLSMGLKVMTNNNKAFSIHSYNIVSDYLFLQQVMLHFFRHLVHQHLYHLQTCHQETCHLGPYHLWPCHLVPFHLQPCHLAPSHLHPFLQVQGHQNNLHEVKMCMLGCNIFKINYVLQFPSISFLEKVIF
jgi:hypothetical protein